MSSPLSSPADARDKVSGPSQVIKLLALVKEHFMDYLTLRPFLKQYGWEVSQKLQKSMYGWQERL